MGGFFWLRPDGAYVGGEKCWQRVPCDDVDAEVVVSATGDVVIGVDPAYSRHAAFPARALGASWSIAALVEPE